MLKRTHEAFSGTFWLGGTLCLNIGANILHAGSLVNPGVAALGLFLAVPFSAGKNSPDVDQLIWPGMPRRGYPWNGHRGITHRLWFASLLTIPFILGAFWVYSIVGHGWYVPLIFALPAGWWSHLLGDMIYGRISVLGVPFGLGWTTGGLSETGRLNGRRVRWIFPDPASKVFTAMTAILLIAHVGFYFWELSQT